MRWIKFILIFLLSVSPVYAASTDNAVSKWHGTDETVIQNSGVIIDDFNNITGVADLTTTGDLAIGTLGTKNPPIDADLFVLRDSADSFNLVTATGTQMKAYLKTYYDTLYEAADTAIVKSDEAETVSAPWTFSSSGGLTLGVEDTANSSLSIHGSEGEVCGSVLLYNGGSNDTTVDYWGLTATGTDFWLGPDIDTDAFVFSNAGLLTATSFAGSGGALTITTTNFGTNFANDTDHDTIQELMDVIDDLSLGGGGATALDDIGDPDAATSISMDDGETLTFSSASDNESAIIIDMTDGDLGGDTNALRINHTSDGSSNIKYLQFYDNSGNDLVFDVGANGNTTLGTLNARTSVLPGTAGTGALGSATKEWADLFLADDAVISGQDDQSNTITSSADGWTFNLFPITPSAAPDANYEVANKKYVDDTLSGAGGSAITLDIGDDAGDDSTDLTEIATTGDTNSVFTMPAADKLLIAVGSNWPTADLASTITVADNESTNENNPILFAAGGDLDGGNYTPESDGDFYYNPSTGVLYVAGGVSVGPSATPSLTGEDNDAANGTFAIYGTSTGAYDIIMSLYVDIAGDPIEFMQLDGVAETIDMLKPVVTTSTVTVGTDLTVTGGDITLGTTSIFSGGDTASLNNIDAIDATTEATIETALDTLSNVTTVGALASGSLAAGFTDVPVAQGGTGASTLTDGGVLLGSGTGAVTAMAVLTDGQMLVGDGTTDPVAESGATLRTSIGVGTGDSPQFTGIELSHATENTLTASSGVLSIEGSALQTAQANVQTDSSGAITLTVNAVNYGSDTGDADIPDGACDAAGDVGNWVVLISSAADQYSLTSNDASNQFIIAANAAALTAGDELDVDGTMVCVMCIAAELWKVTGYMGAIPTDGGVAD